MFSGERKVLFPDIMYTNKNFMLEHREDKDVTEIAK